MYSIKTTHETAAVPVNGPNRGIQAIHNKYEAWGTLVLTLVIDKKINLANNLNTNLHNYFSQLSG